MTEGDWSVPETDVLATMREYLNQDRAAMIATVVRVEGSAYRRPGAKMLVDEHGHGLGHITAGCLEDEVLEIAERVLADGNPRVETYDLMEDDDDVWGLGVGCNGIIDILLEPLTAAYHPLLDADAHDHPVAIISVLDNDAGVPVGAKAYHTPNGITTGEGFPEGLAEDLAEPAEALLETSGADTITIDVDTPDGQAQMEVFIDAITPPPRLVVFGTGHDVGPVVELGKKNDFRVTVIGYRGGTDLETRFPRADHTITTTPGRLLEDASFDDRSYAVVMTHNFIEDRFTVDELLTTQVPYVGLMGPRERFEEMLDEFAAEDRTFTPPELDRVYTPIGLDLGGGAPYQIATSILAEILAVHHQRAPQHLKNREGPIHDRTTIEI